MTDKQNENIQHGLAEIWRREKLQVASLCLLIIIALIVSISTSMVFGSYTKTIVLIIPVVAYLKIWSWVRNTPCPKCGQPYGGHRAQRKCLRCGFELLREKPINYRISFKEIKYQPNDKPRS